MKTIEEKAADYAAHANLQNNQFAFIAGAMSEHEELTRWHDPKQPPTHSNEVLIKYYCGTGGGEFYIVGCYYKGKWKTPLNTLDETYDKILGWREIHE